MRSDRLRQRVSALIPLSAGLVFVLALAGCTGGASTLSAGGPGAGVHSSPPLPDVANGVPLRRLAEIARAEALAEHELSPWNVRAGIGSDRAANALMDRDGTTYNFGDTSRRYVIALDGRFSCDPCAASVPGTVAPEEPTSTTATTTVAVSTMVLTVDPATLTPDGSFRLVANEVDMAKLGKVYDLDPYLAQPSAQSVASSGGGSALQGPGQPCPTFTQPTWWDGSFCGPSPGPGNGSGPQGACVGNETAPPCGAGAVAGRYYAYTLPVRCDGRIVFDGRNWVSELPPSQDGPPMYVWMAISTVNPTDGKGGAGFIGPEGSVAFDPYTGQPPNPCQPPPSPPPAPTTPPNP